MSTNLLGQQLGNYTLIKHLGHGSFGSVYLGKHAVLDNKPMVAIKVLHGNLPSPEERKLFFQEARLLDKLTHPHILPVLDAGEYEGSPFFIVEYAPGGSLRDRLSRKTNKFLTFKEIIKLLSQVGQALQYAHNRNVVHCDLKPENILFNSQGDALLADFGLAREVMQTYRANNTGTPPYMAPEQFMGKMSKKSDQYALGCITYELLTGRPPFSAPDIYALGYQHLHARPMPPSLVNSSVSHTVEAVVLKAISKKRDDRYENVETFVSELRMMAALPTDAPRLPPPYIPKAITSPNMQIRPALTLKALPAPTTSPFSAVQALPSPTTAARPQTSPVPALVPEYLAQKMLFWSVATGGRITSTPSVVANVVYIGSDDKKLYAFDTTTKQLLWSTATEGAISSSPSVVDGTVYVGSFDHNLYAFDAATGLQRWVAHTANFITSAPVVVNGLVYIGSWDYMIHVFEAATGRLVWASHTSNAISSSPAVVNGMVYIGSRDHRLYAFNANTGTQHWLALTNDCITSTPAVVNSVVYIGSWDRQMYAFDAATGQLLWSTITGGAISSSPAVVNGVVYVGSDDHHLYAFNAATGKIRWATRTGGPIESSPTVINGVAYVGSGDHKLYAINADTGQQLWSTTTGGPIVSSPAIINDLAYVGSGDGKLYAFYLPNVSSQR